MSRIDDLLDSLTMAELRALTELKHFKYETRVSDILRIRIRGLEAQKLRDLR